MIAPTFLAALPWVETSRSKPIARVAWTTTDEEPGTLWVELRDGKVYKYANVPAHQAAALVFSPSVGAYWTECIQNVYRSEWVNDSRVCVGFGGAR